MQLLPNHIFFLLFGLALSVFMGIQVGGGQFAIPLVGGLVALLAMLRACVWKKVRVDAIVLGTLLFGNLVSQMGFAKFSLVAGAPVYFAEIGLVLCTLVFGVRMAFTKERFLPRQPLALAIALFLLVGTVRFIADLEVSSGSIATQTNVVRDFATVYYAAFFFLTYNLCKHRSSRLFLERTLAVAVLGLLVVFTIWVLFPQGLEKLAIRGQLLLAPRADLSGSFLGFGFVYYMLSREQFRQWPARTLIALLCFSFTLLGLSRATFVGFFAGMVLLIIARRSSIVRELAIMSVVGGVVLVSVEGMHGIRSGDRFTGKVLDKLTSLVDVGSSYRRSYTSDVGEAAAGNTGFRTAWWTSVYEETVQTAPVTGLGFGYDLAARFLRTYGFPLGEDFSARSPHNILMTVFGRMGLVGLCSFVFVIVLIFDNAFRCAWAVRKGKASSLHLAPWCGVITILVTACFGVMLEGPMAAVVFWSMLGLSSYRMSALGEEDFLTETLHARQRNEQKMLERKPLLPVGGRDPRFTDKKRTREFVP